MTDYAQVLRDMPRRDNTAYHKAMKEAREAFAAAEVALGGPVKISSEVSLNDRGDYIMTMTFTPDT